MKDAGFSSYHTVGSSREDVIEAAERGISLNDTTPLLKINDDHGPYAAF